MQVLTPAITLAICALLKLERLTASLLISIVMITAGTGAATAVEVGVAGFAWMGFFSFLFSVLLEAVRVVYIQLLLGKLKYNAMEVCAIARLHALALVCTVPVCLQMKACAIVCFCNRYAAGHGRGFPVLRRSGSENAAIL